MASTSVAPSLSLAVIGAGPAGLALSLLAAAHLPQAAVTLYDARPFERSLDADPRTLALSLGSVQLLERLGAWRRGSAQPIAAVHVTQQQPALVGGAEVVITAREMGVPFLGAVLGYGAVVAPLQQRWAQEAAREPHRLHTRFSAPVAALKQLDDGRVEVDAGVVESYDLVVVAEGGVFAEQARRAIVHDYRQNAWVGRVTLRDALQGVAYERFTPHGPAALLPTGEREAALVWCVEADDDDVSALDGHQQLAVLNTLFHENVGPITAVSELKSFALGLNAEKTLVEGAIVRIGNAAQTLHPVAGQGLNLGLRDAYVLVEQLARTPSSVATALRRLEWTRSPDRWSTIAATDFLARSFTWTLPILPGVRGLALSTLSHLPLLKRALARQMMFGLR